MKLITKKYKKYKKKTLKQRGGDITNAETLEEIKFVEDFFKSKGQKKPILSVDYFNETDSSNNIITLFQNYNNKTIKNVKLIYPKYHGRTDTKDLDISKVVPNNTIFCFLTLLGNIGITDIDAKNMEYYLKNLKKNEMEKILFNLGRLTEIEKYDPKLRYDELYIFMKCLKNSTWYYPGQKYFDTVLSPGSSSFDLESCARYTIMFKTDSRVGAKGAYSKHRESFKLTKLSDYIDKINKVEDETINIYFFEFCRGIYVDDINSDTVKDNISKLFEYEYKTYVINKNIIKNIQDTKPQFKREFPNITPECCSSSLGSEMLEKEDEYARYPVLYNDDFRYNRKNEFIINLYNKVIKGLKPTKKDMITFISLSFKKQIFLINKLNTLGMKDVRMKILEHIWKALLNKDIYINIFFQNISSFSKMKDKSGINILYDNLNGSLNDYFYIYNEHLKQYKTLFEKEGFEFPYFDEHYMRNVTNYDITDFSNISMKMLIPNQYKLFFNNIKNIIISKKINNYDILYLIKKSALLINLEIITFHDTIDLYETLYSKLNSLNNLKMIVLNDGSFSKKDESYDLKKNTIFKKIKNLFSGIKFNLQSNNLDLIFIKCILKKLTINNENNKNLLLNIDDCAIYELIEFTNYNDDADINIIITNTFIKELKSYQTIKSSNFIFKNQKDFPKIENIKIETLNFINSDIDKFVYNEILEMLIITDPIGSLINIKKLKYKKLKFVGDKFEYKDYKDCPINFNYLESIDISESKFIKSSFIKHFKISYYNLRPGLIVY